MSKYARRLAVPALAIALVSGAAASASAADPPRLTKPVNATKADLDPQRTYSAPAFAVDPENSLHIVGGYAEMRTKQCRLMRSTDGGQTWEHMEGVPALGSYPYCLANNSNIFQAPVAFGRAGRIYMATVAWDTQDTRDNTSVTLHRTDNFGESWTSALVTDVRGKQGDDRRRNRPVTGIAVDSSGREDVVYVNWSRTQNAATNQDAPQPMVGVSRDGGKTFDEPVTMIGAAFEADTVRTDALKTTTTTTPVGSTTTTSTTTPAPGTRAATPNQAANFGGINAALVLGANGTVYSVWRSATANITPTPASALFLSRSTDQGRTFTTHQIAPFSLENRGNTRLAWSPKGGAEGTLHFVYEGTSRPAVANEADIYYRQSTDGGRTWTDATVINDDDPALFYGSYIPNVSVAPNGRVDVVWWDTRNDPGILANDVYYASSEDNGATWTKDRRITDQLIDRKFGVWGQNFDQNSPPSLASTDAFALIGWDDTRQSGPRTNATSFGAGVQDIFTSAVQYKVIGSGSNAPRYMLAGALGLLLVGLLLLAVSVVTRRRVNGGPPAAERIPDREATTVS